MKVVFEALSLAVSPGFHAMVITQFSKKCDYNYISNGIYKCFRDAEVAKEWKALRGEFGLILLKQGY